MNSFWGLRKNEGGVTANRYELSFWGDENILK